jgi:HK97 family phage prohead protease
LKWIADGKAGSGFTDTGRARAVQLAKGDAVSAETILRMYSFFARHEVDKQGKGFNNGDDGFPSAGRVAWDAWGGDEGFTWSSKIREQLSARAALLEGVSMNKRDAMESDVADLPEELAELLGTTVQFYFRAHGAHWNVKGADFSEYHKLFQKIYETAYELIDPIAENLRKIGSVAPFHLAEFAALGYLPDANPGQDPMSLARDLLNANDVFLDELSDCFDCATRYNQQGIANFLAGAIDDQQFYKWQLTASLGEEVTQPQPDPMDAQGVDEDDAEEMPMMVDGMMSTYSADSEVETAEVVVESDEDRAAVDGIGEGTFVSWDSSGGRARGKVIKVSTEGTVKSSSGFALDATPESPVFEIKIYESKDNGYIPTDVITVHKADTLTIITPLPSPRSEETMFEERKGAFASAERVTMDAEVRSLDTGDGSLKIGGYAAQFNKEATGLSFREVIAPGAFKRTLQSNEPVYLLVNHDTNGIPLASTASGTLNLSEDEIGLRMEANLDPANPKAQELYSAISRGDIAKMSFAFTVAPDGSNRSEGLRTLTDLNLFEVSAVTWPAYNDTALGARSAEEAEAEALELRKRMLQLKQKFAK